MHRNKSLVFLLLLITGTSFLISSCKKEEEDPHADLKAEIVANYAEIVYFNYLDSYEGAVYLQNKIDAFVASPSQANLDAAKNAWLAAREPYGQTEAFRFGEGPIDDADGPEGLINAWPLDEGYIDYVTGNPNSGIINDTTISLDAATLTSLNEAGSEENISIGFHAIEFLLWGQDDPDVSLQTPGNRPYTDYVTSGNGTAANQARRGTYLKLCADLLVQHLNQMVNEWAPSNSGNYRSTFLDLESDEALRRMFSGIGILSKSELAGERIFTALDNQDQEDEHSCFSDNTHRDIVTNAKGIRNVYLGSYKRVNGSVISGSSLSKLAAQVNTNLNSELTTQLNGSLSKTEAIPAPFDYALTQETPGGSGPINAAILSLVDQGDLIAQVASALDITISTDLPE